MKHLWDVTSCSAKGGAVLHQRAFTKKNVETLRPINATASVIPVSNLLPLCGNNFRVYKRVRFLPSACAVRAQPRFTPKLRVQPGAAARGSCDYRLSNASAGFFEAAWWTAAIARIRARNVSEYRCGRARVHTPRCVTGEVDFRVNNNAQMEAAERRTFFLIKLVNSSYLLSYLLGR